MYATKLNPAVARLRSGWGGWKRMDVRREWIGRGMFATIAVATVVAMFVANESSLGNEGCVALLLLCVSSISAINAIVGFSAHPRRREVRLVVGFLMLVSVGLGGQHFLLHGR